MIALTQYWLIKLILLTGLILVTWFVMRPVKSPSDLAVRRLLILGLLLFAGLAIVLPGLLNRIAAHLGVERGLNLLVYALVIGFFAQLSTAYRREAAQEKRITALTRAFALADPKHPNDPANSPPHSAGGTVCKNVEPDTSSDSSLDSDPSGRYDQPQ